MILPAFRCVGPSPRSGLRRSTGSANARPTAVQRGTGRSRCFPAARLRARCLFLESASRSSLLVALDLSRKRGSTFQDHALASRACDNRLGWVQEADCEAVPVALRRPQETLELRPLALLHRNEARD